MEMDFLAYYLPLKDIFIRIPLVSERFAASTPFQYYTSSHNLKGFVDSAQHTYCKGSFEADCHAEIATFASAQSLDIDYDAISQTLVLRLLWTKAPESSGWTATFEYANKKDRVEVGVLASQHANQPEEISLGGFLTVLREDMKPSRWLSAPPCRGNP